MAYEHPLKLKTLNVIQEFINMSVECSYLMNLLFYILIRLYERLGLMSPQTP
jgi:hypothetical protein